MGKLLVILAIAYVIVTYYSLRRSSEPVEKCVQGRCLKPLVTSDDRLSLELWILDQDADDDVRKGRPVYRWKVVDTCRGDGMTFDVSDARTTFDPKNGNCTLDLPAHSRQRGSKPLQAKFILRYANYPRNSSVAPVAEAKFDLTRLVERKTGGSSSIWTFNSGGTAAATEKKKLAGSLLSDESTSTGSNTTNDSDIVKDDLRDDTTADASSGPATILVPHFKYRREPIILRYVADEHEYGVPPYRGDGISMQTYSSDRSRYKPIVYVDDTALRHSSQIEMAESGEGRPPLNLRVRVSVISPLRDVVNVQVKMGMEMAESFLHESELDEIRYLISDDHLYRFALTQVISFLHIWLDYMAFKNEVGFYVGKTDMGGLSVSSILTRFACSLIIFLYLCEGGGTSWLILVSVGSGVAADLFKVWKVLKPGLSPTFPFITIRDPSRLSTTEKKTTGYDRIARTYLGLILYPLIAGSALYALHFYVYTSWWSWLISNLANAVYTFGFIALCPQLYINYRLQSVAHMPWKVFMYKLFNTFVDDVFAFLIEMPLKHKIMTLRDDVVFIIFLAQAYMYRVDKKRANEFGFAYEQEEDTCEGLTDTCKDEADGEAVDKEKEKQQ